MWRLVVFSIFLSGVIHSTCGAMRIAFDFNGVVLPPGGAPYGENVPQFTPVSGHFEYDTDSAATHTISASGVGFRQQIPGGFFAQFGATSVVANDYIVVISNDGPTSEDQFIVRFIDDDLAPPLNPPLSAPLLINGNPHTSGQFEFTLAGPNTLYSTNASLPSSLIFGQFSGFNFGVLSDTPGGGIDVLYQVTSVEESIVQTPEPATWWLALIAALCWCVSRLRPSGRSSCPKS